MKSAVGFSPAGESLFETEEDSASINHTNDRSPLVVDLFLFGIKNNQITFSVRKPIRCGRGSFRNKDNLISKSDPRISLIFSFLSAT